MTRSGYGRFLRDDLERNRGAVEEYFYGIRLPEPVSIKKILESSSSPQLSNRIPSLPEYESQDSKLKRYGITGVDLLAPVPTYTTPGYASILNDVPRVRNITKIDQLRADHRVFFNVGNGEVQCVVTQKDVAALRFYRRYYSNVPQIAELPGNVFRSRARQHRNMLTRNGVGIRWLTVAQMAAYLASTSRPSFEDGAEYNIVKGQPASFVPLVDGRPETLDASRVRFVFVHYYSREKVSGK